jgi:hypothetical protein
MNRGMMISYVTLTKEQCKQLGEILLHVANEEENAEAKYHLYCEEGKGFILSMVPHGEGDVDYPVESIIPWPWMK